jgi:hypothetical protein
MNAICLITFQPRHFWCDLLNTFKDYKVFVMVDDNNFNLTEFENKYNNIFFIKIDNLKCKQSGFINSSYIMIKKEIIGWDKALYYFAYENTSYEYVWLLEDDVFFYNENTLLNIDKQNQSSDLLSNKIYENSKSNAKNWHWPRIKIKLPPPYHHGMMCIVRFSKNMFESIKDYATKYKTIFFIEAFFPTIAKKYNLICNCPDEFNEILYYRRLTIDKINKTSLFHPVKNPDSHIEYRNHLE